MLLLLATLVTSACAGRRARDGGPRYRSADELARCKPGECIAAKLEFRRWADAPHHRGRMLYHCDPGSRLDGRPDPAVTRLIFVVHGVVGVTPRELAQIGTPPGLYQFRNVVRALKRAGRADELESGRLAIIAPTFQRTEEWQPFSDEDPRVWTWRQTSWNQGSMADSREGFAGRVRAEAVSSFDVFDEFLRAALIKFPALEQIVVVGHSAGGQAVHRYAYLGVGVHEGLEAEGIELRYVVANPGSYAFPVRRRKLPRQRRNVRAGVGRGDTSSWRWATPRGCETWDDWGFGLSGLAPGEFPGDRLERAVDYAIDTYLRPVDRKLARRARRDVGGKNWRKAARRALILQYASREIWHLQAADDYEDTYRHACAATQQGRSRFERFSNFQEAWQRMVGVSAPQLHFVAVTGLSATHSSRVIYASEAGRHALFD